MMKKRKIYALALAVALVLPVIVLSAMADENSRTQNIDFISLVDVSGNGFKDEAGQYFKSYAFVEQGKDLLKWKEIKPGDLTIGLEWDVSKLIKKPGRLILSSSEASGNTAKSVGDCIDAADDGMTEYMIYAISSIAPSPPPISSQNITYRGKDVFINIGSGNEWSKDGYSWKPADNNGPDGTDTADKWCRLSLSATKQTVYVRGRAAAGNANGITFPSRSVKTTIPAMAKAPKVRIYISEALLSAKAGLEISNDGEVWAKMTGNTLPLGVVTALPASISGDGTVPIDLSDKNDVYIRVPAGGGKPHSDIFETYIRISDTGPVSEEDFSAAPKQTVLVDDSVVIEAFMAGKWKKVKEIAADEIPAAGLKVRRAGTKERLPGPERILSIINQDGYKTISVTDN